jgi:hypothetical protein
MGREPRIGQQPRESVDRMGRQSLPHILQVRERIAPEALAAGHEALQGRRRRAAPVTPDKQGILALMLSSALSKLCPVPVYAEFSVVSHEYRRNHLVARAT